MKRRLYERRRRNRPMIDYGNKSGRIARTNVLHSLLRGNEILRNQRRESSVDDAIAYFDSMATYIDELRKLQRELRHMIR